jgi:hypothetical protein
MSDRHPSLAQFVASNEEVVKTWIRNYDDINEATATLKMTMKATYKEVHPKKKEVPVLAVDLTMRFEEAKACTSIVAEGNRVLVESVKAAASRQTLSMKVIHHLRIQTA